MSVNGQAVSTPPPDDDGPVTPSSPMSDSARLALVEQRLHALGEDATRQRVAVEAIRHGFASVVDAQTALATNVAQLRVGVGALCEQQGVMLAILARLDRSDRQQEGRITQAEVAVSAHETTLERLKRHAPGLAKYGGGTVVMLSVLRAIPDIITAIAEVLR